MPVSDPGVSTRLLVLPRSGCSRAVSMRPRSSWRGSMVSRRDSCCGRAPACAWGARACGALRAAARRPRTDECARRSVPGAARRCAYCRGRLEEAREAAETIAAIAGPSGRERIAAAAAFARGRAATARGDNALAVSNLQKAVNDFAALGLRQDVARARLALARALAAGSSEIAVDTARQARNELEALGDSREADIAAALMRSLGAKGRAGPRAAGLLTQREIEVLRLLGEGLTNAEIAARLFISPKTAEHHASRIFAKLGMTKRSEAAAYAARHLEAE